ncbi:hypothetical protein EVAR_52863_1 [Eumeta japonica]|uniref:Uncharacterized protein n=1 Tax=Eumeta variegata TaxID=151549 RepID=A0A4C1YM19_EUMVA|nr:hypothetical protein EVAR_52863_1 [Eumeta japonica]
MNKSNYPFFPEVRAAEGPVSGCHMQKSFKHAPRAPRAAPESPCGINRINTKSTVGLRCRNSYKGSVNAAGAGRPMIDHSISAGTRHVSDISEMDWTDTSDTIDFHSSGMKPVFTQGHVYFDGRGVHSLGFGRARSSNKDIPFSRTGGTLAALLDFNQKLRLKLPQCSFDFGVDKEREGSFPSRTSKELKGSFFKLSAYKYNQKQKRYSKRQRDKK